MKDNNTGKQPVISIIIPAYQAGRYIGRAIESVLRQTCKESWELLVVDDCSTDNTADVVKQYASDPRIRYLRQNRNQGVAAARNRGIWAARGRYVAFLDADDWWDADKLRIQMKCIARTGTVLCYTARELVYPNGKPTGKVIPVPRRVTYRKLLETNVIPCGSVVMQTDAAREFEFVHDEYHEDYILWLRVLKKYKTAVGVNRAALKCRLSEGGKSRNKWKSAQMQYGSYRVLGHWRLESFCYLILYAWNGVRKYHM